MISLFFLSCELFKLAVIVCNYAHYMLIFQLHLPHVIPNSMQALHALSHSEINTVHAINPTLHDYKWPTA